MINTYSSNMLKTFEECPKKYFLQYIENIQTPQSTKSAETGKNIHALINYYFNGFDVTKIVNSLSQQEKTLWQNFISLGIKKEDIYKSEYSFNVKINENNWLTGRIDAIIKINGEYHIYDWKTGNIPKEPETDLQTCIYLFSTYKILKTKKIISNIEDIHFIYTNLKTNEKVKINLNKEKYVELENKILHTIDKIQSYKVFSPYYSSNKKIEINEKSKHDCKNSKCQKCKYKTIC